MAKTVRLNLKDEKELTRLGKALSSPIRIQMLELIGNDKLSIAEISRKMNIPASSAAMHVRVLEEADLIRIEKQPGTRGMAKLCSFNVENIDIRFFERPDNVGNTLSVSMPVGGYSDCSVRQTCGIADENGIIGMDDMQETFYYPEHMHAKVMWTAGGYVEYIFPNRLYSLPKKPAPISISFSMELCSETAGYQEDWKSDITLWVNGIDCGTWTSPGDFGKRRGKYNPPSWVSGRTQYGLLTKWEIREDGCYINNIRAGNATIRDLNIMAHEGIRMRIGNKEDAKYVGGFNLFGKGFGDYDQDIEMSLVYLNTPEDGSEKTE